MYYVWKLLDGRMDVAFTIKRERKIGGQRQRNKREKKQSGGGGREGRRTMDCGTRREMGEVEGIGKMRR
jgi:hypothetical protein